MKILAVALLLSLTSIQLAAQKPIELINTLSGHTKSIQKIEFSHDGEILASSSNDGTVRLWSVATGNSVATLAGDKDFEPWLLNWSSDDRRLAVTYRRRRAEKVIVWEISTTNPPVMVHQFPGAFFLEWSPNNREFLALDQHANPTIWDAVSGQLVNTLKPQPSAIFSTYTFVAQGQRILDGSIDDNVQLRDVRTGKLLDTYINDVRMEGLLYPTPKIPLVSPDRRFLIRANLDIHDTATGNLLTSIKDADGLISVSPDARTVLAIKYGPPKTLSDRQTYLSIRKIDDGEELVTFQLQEGIHEVVWSPDGKTMAIVGLDFHTRVIDAATGRENGRLPYGNCWPWTMCGSDGCEPIKFSADGQMLLKQKQPIKIWDAKTVSLITVVKPARLPAVFSPTNGQLLATRSEDKKSILLWRLDHLDELSHKEAQKAQELLCLCNFEKSRSVNSDSGDRILVPVRHPDVPAVKDNGFGLKARRDRV